MLTRPVIFISAVSCELRSARDLVAKTLIALGYDAKWQDIAATETGDLTGVLREWVDDSDAVLQLVGHCYGFAPKEDDADFGACSYTQYEALYARHLGKPVYYLFLDAPHPTDGCACEPKTLHDLQEQYRQQVKGYGELYHSTSSLDKTELLVRRMEDKLEQLREEAKAREALQRQKLDELAAQTADSTAALQQLSSQVTQLSKAAEKIERQARSIKLPRLAQCRKDMLAKIRYDWIECVLHPSVSESNRFNIGQELVPSAVITDHRLPDREFRPEDDISKLFDDSGSRLLILGNPGGGKTMLLLRLAERLLERAESDPSAGIPIVLNLSSWWRDRLPLDQWMIREGSAAYQIPIAVMTRWVRDEALIPLLDGLDEVGLGHAAREAWAERTSRSPDAPDVVQDEGIEGAAAKEARAACLDAINAYCQPAGDEPASQTSFGIVVCSRITEYHELTAKLHLHGALMLQDLSESQVSSVMSRDHMKGVRVLAGQEPWIATMSKNPFLLNVMSVAYAGRSLTEKPSQAERQRHLMGEYVNLRLKESHERRQSKKALDATQIRHLLQWLAKNMAESGQTVFHIENLQMTWLSKLWARCTYCVGSRSALGAAGGLLSALLGVALVIGYFFDIGLSLQENGPWGQILVVIPVLGIFGAWCFTYPGVIAATLEWRRSSKQIPRRNRFFYALQFCCAACLLLGPGLMLLLKIIFSLISHLFPQNDPQPELGSISILISILISLALGITQVVAILFAIWFCRRMRIEKLATILGLGLFFMATLGWVLISQFQEDVNAATFDERINILLAVAFCVLGVGMFAARSSLFGDQIQSAEYIGWKWSATGAFVIGGSLLIPAVSLMAMSHISEFETITPADMAEVILVCGVGFIFGGTVFGLKRGEMIQRRVTPNEGVVRSMKSSVLIAAGFGAAGTLVAVAVISIISRISTNEWASLIRTEDFALRVVMFVTMMFTLGAFAGGLDVPTKHWVLRVLLTLSEHIPFRLATKLKETSEVLLLRKVGGGFIFSHRFLLEYFAAAPPSVGRGLPHRRKRRMQHAALALGLLLIFALADVWLNHDLRRQSQVSLRADKLAAQGNYAEAEQEYRTVREIHERELGAENFYTLESRMGVANALGYQSKYAEAEMEFLAVWKIRKRVLGAEHRDTLVSRMGVAVALNGQGKYAEAEQEHRAVLKIQARVLGPEHADTLATRINLANALASQEKHAEAEQELRVVSQIQERVLGAEHTDALASRMWVAEALEYQGKPAEAEQEYRALVKIRERLFGAEHADTLASRNNLANSLDGQGKHAEAEQEHRAVLKIRERVLGAEHPDVALSCQNLAVCLEAQHKLPEAIEFMQRAEKVWTKALGPEHPDTKRAKAECERMEEASHLHTPQLQGHPLRGNQMQIGYLSPHTRP